MESGRCPISTKLATHAPLRLPQPRLKAGQSPLENILVIRPNGTISAEQARRLLRRFRDLNLGPCGIEINDHERIVVSGCLSLDHPVENGVRYSLKDGDRELILRIHWADEQLVLQLSDPGNSDTPLDNELGVSLSCDRLGRVSAPDLGARLHLEDGGPMDIEHFLRRIVRAVYSEAS
ncbi:MAG: hypothetical protein ACI9F9_000923 [Candidatus Paceibacteria bacterium]